MALPPPPLRLLPLVCAMLLAGCAAQGEFPSLAPRPIEFEEAPEAAEAAPAPVVDPELVARIAALVADARRGQDAFAAILPEAASLAAAASDVGSDGWVEAQQAISRLESARAPTVIALAELDRLAIAHAGTPDLAAVTAAVDEARRLAEAQGREIETLRARLSPL